MALAAGARLGPYEILSTLGAGGMGEVYKARDTRLDRTVAVKILPAALAADPKFRERFDREARAISRLTHPNICALYDVGEHDDTAFLVMELLDGQTLADRLKKGAMPLDEALKIAIQIADALNAAHRHGIVHRDLKPGNVILTKAGAKLLDFGLAKASGSAIAVAGLSMLQTTPANLTAVGTILGTSQYMAPEQLEGQGADARTDIFAFGTVLFEMLTGKKAFEGKSHASLIAAILEHDPPQIAALQPLAPSALDYIVKKCLAKDPDERWQNAGDLTSELTWIATSGGALTTAVALPASSRGERRALTWSVSTAAVALFVGAVATYLVIGRFDRGANTDVARVLVGVTPAERLQALLADKTSNEGRPSRTTMVWSPDGRSIVFSGAQGDRQQLYVRALDQLDAPPIAGTEGAADPFFSPDGRWLGFWSAGALRKIPMGGGPPTTLCESPPVFGASWGSNDTIVFSRSREGLWRISAAGGTPQRVTTPDAKKGEVKHLLPSFFPATRRSCSQSLILRFRSGTTPRSSFNRSRRRSERWWFSRARMAATSRRAISCTCGQADVSTMMAVPVTLAPSFTAGAPRVLFEGRYGATAIARGYDVAPDGRRFLMVQQKERAPTVASHMILVQNWFDELRKRVPTRWSGADAQNAPFVVLIERSCA